MRPPAPALGLALCLAAAPSAGADPGASPQPGKLEVQTVGTTPQMLTTAERAKLERATRSVARVVHGARTPRAWVPPGSMLRVPESAATPATAPTARANPAPRDGRAEVRAYLSHVNHGAPPPAKAAQVNTIGNGPREPGAAELAKRRTTPSGAPR